MSKKGDFRSAHKDFCICLELSKDMPLPYQEELKKMSMICQMKADIEVNI